MTTPRRVVALISHVANSFTKLSCEFVLSKTRASGKPEGVFDADGGIVRVCDNVDVKLDVSVWEDVKEDVCDADAVGDGVCDGVRVTLAVIEGVELPELD